MKKLLFLIPVALWISEYWIFKNANPYEWRGIYFSFTAFIVAMLIFATIVWAVNENIIKK
jgi:hypothetical protein